MQQLTPGPGDLTTSTSDDGGGDRAVRPSLDDANTPSPTVDDSKAGSLGDDDLQRRNRRTLAQREAAARSDLAAVTAARRRLRTRGAIVAGGVLLALLRARPALAADVAQMIESLASRDREAILHFVPGTEIST